MAKVYTFNRPIVGLILVPLLFLTLILFYGVFQEFNFLVVLLTLVSLLFLMPIIYLAFFRRLRIEEEAATWVTPRLKRDIPWAEVRHYGVIKYRSFRFMFLSREEVLPFQDPTKPVVSDKNTFLVQFRRKGWQELKNQVQQHSPELKPTNIVRK